MSKIHGVILAAALLVSPMFAWAQATGPAPAAGPVQVGNSAYERLDPTRLADALSQLGLTSLLPLYIDELQASSPLDAQFVEAEILISQARANKGDLKAYLEAMDKAIAKLTAIVNASAGAAEPYALLRSFRYRVQLADVAGNEQIEPLWEKMLYLHAGPEDRKLVVERTAKAAEDFDKLTEKVKEVKIDLNADTAKMMAIGNDMAELEKTFVFKAGYAFLARGMALDEGRDKAACLRRTITAMERFLQDTDEEAASLKYEGMLLTGQASRELKEWQRAIDLLKGAAAPGADPDTRAKANFELGRALAEKGDFEAARKQADEFKKIAGEIYGKGREVAPDMQYAFLKSYLYEQWANSLRKADPAKAGEYDALTQKALIDFAAAHPEAAAELYNRIAARYAGADYGKLPSMIIIAKVTIDLGKAKEGTAEWDTVTRKALDGLASVLKRDDPGSKEIAPTALYTIAYIHSRNGRNIDAAAAFFGVAGQYPGHALAFNSVLNAVISYNNLLQDKIEKKLLVPPSLRWSLVKCYRMIFAKKEWAADEKAQALRFGFGWQLHKLAELDDAGAEGGASQPAGGASAPAAPAAAAGRQALFQEAIIVLESVAPLQSEYMEARFIALQDRQMLLKVLAPAAQKAAAGDLVKAAAAFIADAGKLAESARAANKENDYKSLREWAAGADTLIAATNFFFLGNKEQAVAQLQAMATKWPGTSALQQAAQLQIQFSLLDNQTSRAAKLVREFREKYPAEAAGLIRMVINQLRQQIKQLRNDPSQLAALNSYRKAYYEFAKMLYEDNKKSTPDATMEQLYEYEQMFGDATLEMGLAGGDAGLFTAALAAFEKCQAHDDAKRAEMAKKIDAQFAALIAQVQPKNAPAAVVEKAADDLLSKLLPAVGIDPKTMPRAIFVRSGLQAYRQAVQRGEKNDTNVLRANTLACCTAAVATLKKGLPIDPVNLWGLARAQRAMKKYNEALANYNLLINGIDKQASVADYWQSELEYCEAAIESVTAETVATKKADDARKLSNRVKQLRADDSTLGGLLGRFGAIEAQADRLRTP